VILLDTHAWIWWVNDPGELSRPAREAVEEAAGAGEVYVSSISVWEMAMLVAKGRLKLSVDVEDWLAGCESLPFLRFVPVDHLLALKSVRLAAFDNDDPADRIIVATAIALGKTLVTRDLRMRRYRPVKTVW
jgi:PIN domain nuclease of toxin-antitoxin system